MRVFPRGFSTSSKLCAAEKTWTCRRGIALLRIPGSLREVANW